MFEYDIKSTNYWIGVLIILSGILAISSFTLIFNEEWYPPARLLLVSFPPIFMGIFLLRREFRERQEKWLEYDQTKQKYLFRPIFGAILSFSICAAILALFLVVRFA